VIISGTSSPSDYRLCSAAKENLGGLRPNKIIANFKQLTTQRLVAQGTDFCQHGMQRQTRAAVRQVPQLFGNVFLKWRNGDGSKIKYELFLLKLKSKNPNICILKSFFDQFS
jgi:hypothetical protein